MKSGSSTPTRITTSIFRRSRRAIATSSSSARLSRARSRSSPRSTRTAARMRRLTASSIASRRIPRSWRSASRIKPDMTYKDTAHNVRVTEEFTVNIVDHALVEAMNVCAIAFPSDVDEIATAGLTAVPGTHVRCPRIAEAAGGCSENAAATSPSRSESPAKSSSVTCSACHSSVPGAVDPATKYVDQRMMDAIGRMGGHGCSRPRATSSSSRPRRSRNGMVVGCARLRRPARKHRPPGHRPPERTGRR